MGTTSQELGGGISLLMEWWHQGKHSWVATATVTHDELHKLEAESLGSQ